MKPTTEVEILKPRSRRWKEFVTVLEMLTDERGCDNDHGLNPGAPELVRSGARAIMEAMGGVDIDASLKHFDEHGGYCDCEILFNVDRSDDDDDDELRDLTRDERRWFDAAVKALKRLEPVRDRRNSHRRIQDARRALEPLLKEGLTADEFRAALKMLPGNALLSLAAPAAGAPPSHPAQPQSEAI